MNIWTFDLDYCFPENSSIFDYSDIDTFSKQNTPVYLYGIKLLKKLISGKQIIFLNTHDEILKYINNGDNVVNIDFHHDISYLVNEKTDLKYYYIDNMYDYLPSEYKESNWAGYAITNLNINYFWIGHKDSYIDDCIQDFNFKRLEYTDILKNKYPYDIIYLIKSENYVTEKQLNLIKEVIDER